MNFILFSFALNIKKFAKYAIIMLIITPVIISILQLFLQSNEGIISVSAGVYINSAVQDNRIYDDLSANETINFVQFFDRGELTQAVKTGEIDSGYIFDEAITVITSERSLATPIINEIVSAAVLRSTAQEITRDSITHFFGETVTQEDIYHFTAWQFAAYEEMDIFMSPTFIATVGYGEPPSLTDILAARVTRGIVGLMILIFIVFIAPIFAKEQSMRAPLRIRKKLMPYMISLFFAIFIIAFAIGLVGLIASGIFTVNEFIFLALYTAIIGCIMTLLWYFTRAAKLVSDFGLFIIIANIIFGGVIIDLGEINQMLGYVQWGFPLFWYTTF